jgi:hypothetical protein
MMNSKMGCMNYQGYHSLKDQTPQERLQEQIRMPKAPLQTQEFFGNLLFFSYFSFFNLLNYVCDYTLSVLKVNRPPLQNSFSIKTKIGGFLGPPLKLLLPLPLLSDA